MKTIARLSGPLALVSSLLALVLVAAGTSYAAGQLAKNSVGTKQLKKDAVTGAKVKDGSLTAQDFAPGQLPAGATGPAGPAGPAGSAAITRLTKLRTVSSRSTPNNTGEVWARAGSDLGTFTITSNGATARIEYVTAVNPESTNVCAFELRVDGADSLGYSGTGDTSSDVTQSGATRAPATLTALFTGLSAGQHTLSVWARPIATGPSVSCTVNSGGWSNAAYVSEYAAGTPVVVTGP